MTLQTHIPDSFTLTLKPNSEAVLPPRGAFASLPKFRVISVVKDGKIISTEYWPTNGSLPSTKSSKHVRLINLNWNDVKVNAEYDDTSKVIKVLKGNVDSITIEVS